MIPEDIKAAALRAWSSDNELMAIAEAILTERERCLDAVKRAAVFHYASMGTAGQAIRDIAPDQYDDWLAGMNKANKELNEYLCKHPPKLLNASHLES